MKKRFSAFSLLNFFIVLILLLRQIYYMNLISSFVVSNQIKSGFTILLGLVLLLSLIVYVVYYLPALLVIKVVINIEFRITLSTVRATYRELASDFIQVKNNIYRRLQVIRC